MRGVHTFSHGPLGCCFNHLSQAELTSLTFAANDIKQRVVLPTAFCRRKLTPKFIKQKSQLYRPQTHENGEHEVIEIETHSHVNSFLRKNLIYFQWEGGTKKPRGCPRGFQWQFRFA
ncbi:MAG: hypothetical protein CMO74_04365 [Verrucomicrobiales bacterium]|nr:hypothetical protein [Verrucomicrobiales bacterium]